MEPIKVMHDGKTRIFLSEHQRTYEEVKRGIERILSKNGVIATAYYEQPKDATRA